MRQLGSFCLTRASLWLTAIRDAFIVLLPLTFLGLIPLVLQHFPWTPYRDAMTQFWGEGWPLHLERLTRASHGIFGMVLASVIAALLVRRLPRISFGNSEVSVMIVSISALINFMLVVSARSFSIEHLGHAEMLQGMVVGIATTELLRLASRWRWLRLNAVTHDSDSTYHQAMHQTLSVIGVGLLFFCVTELTGTLPEISRYMLSPVVVWAQLQQADATWLLSSLAIVLNQTAWFLGVHGSKLLDTYGASLFASSGYPFSNALAWRPLFDHFALMGGTGATLSLVIVILLKVPHGPQRQIAKWSLLPALFNINEAVLYGLPIVLNGAYLLPFLCVPLLFTLITLTATELGLVQFLAIDMPWTTPPLLSGWLLTGSWRGAALQLLEIGLGMLIYLPFVHAAERSRKQREAQEIQRALTQIAEESQRFGRFVIRQDQTGMIARSLLHDLREALKKDQQELWLAYQPKHDIQGRVVGVEALVRWTHRVHGPISPAVVIALSESSRTIQALGVWVLEQACACKARWNALGYRQLTMAVNLSPLQLEDSSFADKLQGLQQRHGLNASEIELEITESAAIPDSQAVEQTLHRFTAMGVRLTMDDFGMGYSSLLYLRRFHVHAIKIDGSLTRDVLTNVTNAEIIRTIVSLGRSQKVEVVAEFVETQAQRARLAELGCDIFQGYFHSPALPEAQCPDYFAQHLRPHD